MEPVLIATSLDALGHSFAAAAGKFGINAFAFGLMPTSDELGGLPLVRWPNWIEFYAVNGFAHHDIVFDEMQRAHEPFTWKELKSRRPGEGLRVFDACSAFGWNDGLTVPVDRPHLRHGFVSLATPSSSLSLDSSDRAELTQLAVAAYAKVQALALDTESVPQHLSVREQEALSLVAAGLSDARIAAAMSISTTTAHAHVERAKRRLGARTRAHAVALAMTAKMI